MTETKPTPPAPPATETPTSDEEPTEETEAEEPAEETEPAEDAEPAEEEETEEGEEGITEEGGLPANPLNDPGKDLERLVDKGINDDLWAQAVQGLPCTEATTDCIRMLQDLASANNALVAEIDARMEEIGEKIEEAKARNQRSIKLSVLTPAVRAVLDYQPPAQTTTGPDGKPVAGQTKRQSFFHPSYS